MEIQAATLRLADTVLLPGVGELEVRRLEKDDDVRAWFRGDEDNEEPSRVWGPAERLEIRRPGSLFGPRKRPKSVAEGREQIFERMQALGWTVRRSGYGLRNDYVTDPADTTRLQLRAQSVHLQRRAFEGGVWRWNADTTSLGQIIEYACNLDENVSRLLRLAERDAAARLATDEKWVAAAGKQARPSVAVDDGEELGDDTAGEDGDDFDRFGDQRTRHGDDGFLDELFETAQSAEPGPGVDSADAAGMAGAPGLQEVERLGPAHFADRNAVGPQPQRGAHEFGQ